MKRAVILMTVLVAVLSAHPAFSGNADQGMDHSRHVGEKIHESIVAGYQFAYHMVDLKEAKTRHLMVYIMGPDGKQVDHAKVGFLVKGPDGSKQKLMAAGMKGAFGVNADLKAPGTYMIKVKVVTNGKKLMDEFTYDMK